MTGYDLLRCIDLAGESAEIRFPVAYSHGGFAQMRQEPVPYDVNPLGPIPVPAQGAAVTETPVELELYLWR